MDKNKRLDELRTQRDSIQNHLAWLDRQIAELDAIETSAHRGTAPEVLHQKEGRELSEVTATAKAATPAADTLPPVISSEGLPSEPGAAAIEQQLDRFKNSGKGSVQSAKVGCLIFFIVCTAGFLFLLFGLPYLLD